VSRSVAHCRALSRTVVLAAPPRNDSTHATPPSLMIVRRNPGAILFFIRCAAQREVTPALPIARFLPTHGRLRLTTMLKGIHPLLTADLLHALAGMGHGDEIVLADANFPATRLGRRVIELPGASAPAALDAVLTVFPLDAGAAPTAITMQVIGDPAAVPEAVAEFAAILERHDCAAPRIGSLERHVFYERARGAAAVVRTGELRRYGNILLVKGVINRYDPPR
jgi:L-fucose mutarotase